MRNYQVIEVENGVVPIKAWINGVLFEDHAKAQLTNVAKLPFIKALCVMPDVHAGRGSTVGSVIVTDNVLIPATVGADISCGMQAVCTGEHVEGRLKDLPAVRRLIEKAIPNGRTDNGGKHDKGAWHDLPEDVGREWEVNLEPAYKRLVELHPKMSAMNTVNHLGTLGSGNHFIEVCLDQDDIVWIMLHSGSRGMGARIGQYFTNYAKQEMEKWYIKLPDYELSYLPKGTQGFDDYLEAVRLCTDYARANRDLMMKHILEALHIKHVETTIDCHHNFIAIENHFGKNVLVTRKGAIRAKESDWCIIPSSMGTPSIIGRGLGSKDSYQSCSHGTGRTMSRTEAKRTFTLKDHVAAMEGIEGPKDSSVIDETPGCYKNLDAVLEAQSDLVKVEYRLRQIVNVKGTE